MKNKKALMVLIACSLVISLSACGSKNNSSESNSTPAETTTTEVVTESTETTKTADKSVETLENEQSSTEDKAKSITIDQLDTIGMKIRNASSFEEAEKIAKESFSLDENSRYEAGEEKGENGDTYNEIRYDLNEELPVSDTLGSIEWISIDLAYNEKESNNSIHLYFVEETTSYNKVLKVLQNKYGEPYLSDENRAYWKINDENEVILYDDLIIYDDSEHRMVSIGWTQVY